MMAWRERDECDCFNEEVDVVEGFAWCPDCGTRRYLTGEELTRRLAQEAEWQAEYDRYCHELEQQQEAEERYLAENPGLEIPVADDFGDGIPF